MILSTVHRRENWGAPLQDIAQSFLEILARFPDTALLLPLHRNPTVREPLKAALDQSSSRFFSRATGLRTARGGYEALLFTADGLRWAARRSARFRKACFGAERDDESGLKPLRQAQPN